MESELTQERTQDYTPIPPPPPVSKFPTLASQLVSQLDRQTEALRDLDVTLDGVHVELARTLQRIQAWTIAACVLSSVVVLLALLAATGLVLYLLER